MKLSVTKSPNQTLFLEQTHICVACKQSNAANITTFSLGGLLGTMNLISKTTPHYMGTSSGVARQVNCALLQIKLLCSQN